MEPMRIFLSHNLRHLEYNFYDLDRAGPARTPIAEPAAGWVAGLFAGVAHDTSDVRVFHLILPRSIITALRASELLLEAVPKLSTVVSFQIPYNIPIPPGALSHLSGYSQLHSLAMVIRCEEFLEGVPEIPHSSFPALRTIKIMVDSTSWCTAFLSKVCSPQVSSVSLDIDVPARPDDCNALFTTLACHPSAAVLETLTVRFGGSTNDPSVPILPPVLLPLCSLHSLQRIRIDCGCYTAVDDDSLLQMVRAWPQLRMADLCRSYDMSSAPRVTLSGLAAVMEHCRNIHTLKVPLEDIDGREVSALLARKPPRIFEPTPAADSPGETRLTQPLFCPLMRLGVGPSVITKDDVGGVAAVLSQWFPALRSIEYYFRHMPSRTAGGLEHGGPPANLNMNPNEQQDRWQEVAEMVPAMALARTQEQLWAYVQR